MKRIGIAAISVLALAACDPKVPDSAAGVGFNDYDSYQAGQPDVRSARNAQLADASALQPPEVTGAPSATAVPAPAVSSADLAAAGIGSTAATGTVITPAPGAPLSAISVGGGSATSSTGLSDEQSFAAVSARESIQSDAERLAAQRAQYQDIAPEAVPERPSSTGPDIVAYALNTKNPVGQQAYRRTLPSQSKAERKCASYHSADIAQREFLAAGGPDRDRYGIDPDGDGFACGWNPEPFRRAVGG